MKRSPRCESLCWRWSTRNSAKRASASTFLAFSFTPTSFIPIWARRCDQQGVAFAQRAEFNHTWCYYPRRSTLVSHGAPGASSTRRRPKQNLSCSTSCGQLTTCAKATNATAMTRTMWKSTILRHSSPLLLTTQRWESSRSAEDSE